MAGSSISAITSSDAVTISTFLHCSNRQSDYKTRTAETKNGPAAHHENQSCHDQSPQETPLAEPHSTLYCRRLAEVETHLAKSPIKGLPTTAPVATAGASKFGSGGRI